MKKQKAPGKGKGKEKGRSKEKSQNVEAQSKTIDDDVTEDESLIEEALALQQADESKRANSITGKVMALTEEQLQQAISEGEAMLGWSSTQCRTKAELQLRCFEVCKARLATDMQQESALKETSLNDYACMLLAFLVTAALVGVAGTLIFGGRLKKGFLLQLEDRVAKHGEL